MERELTEPFHNKSLINLSKKIKKQSIIIYDNIQAIKILDKLMFDLQIIINH